MHDLYIRHDWAHQISKLREQLTDDTNIIRWGNGFYRCCRAGEPVELRIVTSDQQVALPLRIRPSDLYITEVGTWADMGRYGSLTNDMSVDAPKFDNALCDLAKNRVHGDAAFALRSLVVFCIAEALRFDTLAHDIGFAFRTMGVAGGAKPMPLGPWWSTVHSWGKACDAVWAGLDPEMRRASLVAPSARSGAARTRSGRANYERMSGLLLEAAKGTVALKRPKV